VGFLTIQ
jgi:hypothetical protein